MNVKRTILLVDDDPINIAVLTAVLSGYECLTASTGEDAIEACSREVPDLVLLDIMMPGIDGYETCRRLRANPASRVMKIILISAMSTTPERVAGYAAGADDYLIKPFDHRELLAKVEVFMRLKTSEELGDLKTSLLNLVAHEIRTPLTGILPAAEILLNEDDLEDEDRRAWATMILENGERLMSLAERGLILCQLRADMGLPMNPVEFSLTELIDSALVDAAPAAEERDIALVSRLHDCRIRGDRKLLGVALDIILEKITELCRPGGSIRFESCGSDRGVGFRIAPDSISDDADFTNLFVVFGERRVGGEVIGGTLDLALAREIVRAHSGELDADATLGTHAAIVGWLPTSEEVSQS